jgi:protein TonB
MVVSTAGEKPAVTRTGWMTVIGVFVVLTPILWYLVYIQAGATYSLAVMLFLAMFQAAVVALYVFMLLYAWGDAARIRINQQGWTAWVAILPILSVIVGIILVPDFLLVVAVSGLLLAIAVYLIYTGFHTGEWRRATIPLSTIFQLVLLVMLILVPLLYTEALPKQMLTTFLAAPPPPPPPPPPAQPVVQKVTKIPAKLMDAGRLRAPRTIPKEIAMIKEEQLPDVGATGVIGGVPGGVAGGAVGGVIGGIIGGVVPQVLAPPKVEVKRIRVGGNVQQAKLVNQVMPVYPPLAKSARIQGTVRLEAIISKDGAIQNLRVITGHPLLIQSAMDAVRQWRYQPTLLNGEPVEVVTTIDVVFTLAQ